MIFLSGILQGIIQQIIYNTIMLYKRIHDLRVDNDKKQKDLAEYLNVRQSTYSKYERGDLPLTAEILIEIADYYGVSVDYMLGRTDKKRL